MGHRGQYISVPEEAWDLTALQFAKREEGWIDRYLSKPYREIWNELNGRSVYPVTVESKSTYKSISKGKTFTPASMDETFVFAQLSKNLENACIKARKYQLLPNGLSFSDEAGLHEQRYGNQTEQA